MKEREILEKAIKNKKEKNEWFKENVERTKIMWKRETWNDKIKTRKDCHERNHFHKEIRKKS